MILFNNEVSANNTLLQLIERVAYQTLAAENLSLDDYEISVTLTDNAGIKELNRRFRNKDTETDVLSFPQYEPGELNTLVILPILLGDIVISVEKAEAQAIDYGHSTQRELGFLTVHGLLHLLGYDHDNMIKKQENILSGLGLER